MMLALSIALIASIFIGIKVRKFRDSKKRFLLYILGQGLLLVIFEAILYNLKETTLNSRFISLQVYFLIMGSVHLIFYHQIFKKFNETQMYKEIAIVFNTAMYMAVFLIIIMGYYDEIGFIYYKLGALLMFIMPTLCHKLFETAISIPARLHKRWFYPLNSKYPSPHISEMRNIVILNLVFQKRATDNHIINFKVKAPRAIDFGRLFYYFINDYNDKNPNSLIHFLDNKNEPFGWYFHTKPEWFSSSTYIDPELSIDTNNIKDGATIICQRI